MGRSTGRRIIARIRRSHPIIGEDPWRPSISGERAPGRSASPAAATDPQVAAALEEYLDALNSDSPPVREEFLDRHPTIAGALAECLSGLEFIQATGWQLGAGVAPWPSAAQDDEIVLHERRLGDYRIVRELGRGSMGVVYEARQVSLGRRVALKVLPLASAIDPRQRQRFLIEAQAAAQLNHPHIVPIYAAGCDQGVHFYAMQYVDGHSLAEVLVEHRERASAGAASGPSPPPGSRLGPMPGRSPGWGSRRRRRSSMRTAWAWCTATSSRPTSWSTPGRSSGSPTSAWRRFRGDLSLTRSGDLVGTLRYMSPEQALARRGVVDQRTDIYALGLTLYEMLTLRPAFDGRDHSDLLRQIAQEEPVPPRRIDPAIPRDLETIVMKASCKEPCGPLCHRAGAGRRPGAIPRRPADPGPPAHGARAHVRWARRHKQIVVTAVTVLVLALAGGAAVVGLQAKKTRQDLQRYIRKSFPAIDAITMTAMQQATESAMGLQSEIRQARKQMVYEKALTFYKEAAKLPPTDLASRTIIARAHYRIGFTHAVMAYAWGKSSSSSAISWPRRNPTIATRSRGSRPCSPSRPGTSTSAATSPMRSGNGGSAGS